MSVDELGDEEETEQASPQKNDNQREGRGISEAIDDDDDLERGQDNVILTTDDL